MNWHMGDMIVVNYLNGVSQKNQIEQNWRKLKSN